MSIAELDCIRTRLAERPRPNDLAARRERLDSLGADYALPPNVTVESVVAQGVRAEWTSTDAANASQVLLFLHGGGYMAGSLASHRHVVAQAGRNAGTRTLAIAYQLAPEHPFPAALEDALSGYQYVLDCGIAPECIVLAGESAGGGLALATVMSLREAGLPLPRCLWLSSPWVDLALTGSTLAGKAAVDPLLSRAYLTDLAAAYLAGSDPHAPLVSPINGDLTDLPPMLIQVGSDEVLLDDAIRLASVAGAADVSVTLQVWPHMIHAWHLFYPEVEEGRSALRQAGSFIRSHLDGTAQP